MDIRRISRRLRMVARFVAILGFTSTMVMTAAHSDETSKQYVREQRTVSVQGVKETWQLVWDGKPSTVCGPDEVYMAITCPCSGFAYAEYGKLWLVRRRGGREIERMDIVPLFGKSDYPEATKVKGTAYLQRWPLEINDLDREDRGDPKLVSEIKRRPAPTIMQFADYDRDGNATEFLIQVGTLPCGKLQFAAIGVSANEPHLHALTTVGKPDVPLIMPVNAWEALLKSPHPHTVTTWPCGDHGSDVRNDLVVSARKGEIRVKSLSLSCPSDNSTGRLIEET